MVLKTHWYMAMGSNVNKEGLEDKDCISASLCVQSAHHSASLTDALVAADSPGALRKLALSACLP